MLSEPHQHCTPGPDGSCSVCSDEALVGLVERIDYTAQTADVRLPNGSQTVALDLINDVARGDTVLVHMGFAISRMRPDD